MTSSKSEARSASRSGFCRSKSKKPGSSGGATGSSIGSSVKRSGKTGQLISACLYVLAARLRTVVGHVGVFQCLFDGDALQRIEGERFLKEIDRLRTCVRIDLRKIARLLKRKGSEVVARAPGRDSVESVSDADR